MSFVAIFLSQSPPIAADRSAVSSEDDVAVVARYNSAVDAAASHGGGAPLEKEDDDAEADRMTIIPPSATHTRMIA
jgi:hypothetical protein